MSSVWSHTIRGTKYPLKAAFGNDGIYNPGSLTSEEVVSLAHTDKENNPWWMVDLEGVYCIWAVRILNRGIFYNYSSFCFTHHISKYLKNKTDGIIFDCNQVSPLTNQTPTLRSVSCAPTAYNYQENTC